MPSGGSRALSHNEKDWEYVKKTYYEACKHGLQYEWLDYFIGGIVNDKKSVFQAAYDAAIEWDF